MGMRSVLHSEADAPPLAVTCHQRGGDSGRRRTFPHRTRHGERSHPAMAPIVPSLRWLPWQSPDARQAPSLNPGGGSGSGGSATNGLSCNLTMVGHQSISGGFKASRYVDTQGHVCALYDTAILYPTNAINLLGPSLGSASRRTATRSTRRARPWSDHGRHAAPAARASSTAL